MKVIYKIAKNELRYLWYSPIAWFVMIVFTVECAFFFAPALYDIANTQDVMEHNSPMFHEFPYSLTFALFINSGIFVNVIANLYLFIPVLTMGLINRETQAGSIKLLYSSPVSIWQIVLGKYLGIMLYNLVLVALVGIFVGIGLFSILHVDYGTLLSALLGFYLIVCTFSAMGLFMSSLSTYPIVSALGTFVIIFILAYIGGLWQKYDVVRDLTWFLSFQHRVRNMLMGLISTKDVIFFIAVSFMFIGFALVKLKSGREDKPWYVRIGRYTGVLAVTLLVGYISSRPVLIGYWDTTATHRNTIPGPLRQIVREMRDSPVTVTLYTNLLDQSVTHGLPGHRNALYMGDMWEPYLRFNPDIKFQYEYYYDSDAQATDSILYRQYRRDKTLEQIANDRSDEMDEDLSDYKTPEQMRSSIDLRPESYRLVMQVQYKGRKEFLRTYNDKIFWPDANNVAAAFKRLLKPDSIPTVYFISGELERNIFKTGEREYAVHTAYKRSRGAMINLGFNVDTVDLALEDIPGNAAALVLADPKMDLSPVIRQKLNMYIKEGGNMLILGEPGKQYVLNPFLKQLGVQLADGELVQPNVDETPDQIDLRSAPPIGELSEQYSGLKKGYGAAVSRMFGATAFTVVKDSGFTIKPLFATQPGRSWLKSGNLVVDSTLPAYNPAAGDLKVSSFVTILGLTRKVGNKEQRIIVCGDADFASNVRMQVGYLWMMAFYSWLTYNHFPIYMRDIPARDTLLNTNARQAAGLKITTIWILPGLMLVIGTLLLIRRKRK